MNFTKYILLNINVSLNSLNRLFLTFAERRQINPTSTSYRHANIYYIRFILYYFVLWIFNCRLVLLRYEYISCFPSVITFFCSDFKCSTFPEIVSDLVSALGPDMICFWFFVVVLFTIAENRRKKRDNLRQRIRCSFCCFLI